MTAVNAQAINASLHSAQSHRAAVATLVMTYAILLAVVYQFIISPRFAYLAFRSVGPDPLYVVLDVFLCGGLALLLPQFVSKPSDLGRIVIFFVVTVPAVVIPTFLDQQWAGAVLEAKIYGVISFLVLTGMLTVVPRVAIPPIRLPGNFGLYILLGLAAVAVVVLGSSYGFSIEIHTLTDVYDQREIYSEGGGGSGFVGLATGLLQNALAPVFLAIGMYQRSIRWFAVGVLLMLYIYSITGLKTALVGMVFVIGIYALTRLNRKETFSRAWAIAITLFVAFAALGSSTPFISVLIDLVVRRILVMQGMLTFNYIDIFGPDEPTYFSHTIFGVFFERPFQGVPPEIVGNELFGRSVHANASFVADGYVSGKLLGVLVAAIAVALFLAMLDALSAGLASPVTLTATCMVILVTTQSGVVTALLNHGGLALAASLWLAGSALATPTPGRAGRRLGSDKP